MPDAKKSKELKLVKKSSQASPSFTDKNCFYNKVLDKAEQLDFQSASGIDGIDDEITLLRVKILTIIENDPENIKLILEVTNMLAKLVKIRYSMNKKQEKKLGEAIHNIIRDIGVPLGVAVLSKKL